MSHLNIKLIPIFLIISVSGISCQSKSTEVVSPVIYSATKEKISRSILISGKTEVLVKTPVNAIVSGTIKSVKAEVGTKVKKGDPLFEYDVDSVKKTLETYEKGFLSQLANKKNSDIQMESLRVALNRTKLMYSKNIASRKEVEDAERAVQTQTNSNLSMMKEFEEHEKGVKKLQNMIAVPIVVSPIAGMVVEAPNSGAAVNENDKVMIVADVSVYEVSGRVLESEVGLLKGNEIGSVNVSAARPESYQGKVKSVGHNPLVDPNSNLGTYPVSVQITNSDEKLQPGMSADVTLLLETKENVIVIPVGAVRNEQGQDYVDVSKAGLSIKRKVKLGLVNDVSAEVVEGLAEGESVRMP